MLSSTPTEGEFLGRRQKNRAFKVDQDAHLGLTRRVGQDEDAPENCSTADETSVGDSLQLDLKDNSGRFAAAPVPDTRSPLITPAGLM